MELFAPVRTVAATSAEPVHLVTPCYVAAGAWEKLPGTVSSIRIATPSAGDRGAPHRPRAGPSDPRGCGVPPDDPASSGPDARAHPPQDPAHRQVQHRPRPNFDTRNLA